MCTWCVWGGVAARAGASGPGVLGGALSACGRPAGVGAPLTGFENGVDMSRFAYRKLSLTAYGWGNALKWGTEPSEEVAGVIQRDIMRTRHAAAGRAKGCGTERLEEGLGLYPQRGGLACGGENWFWGLAYKILTMTMVCGLPKGSHFINRYVMALKFYRRGCN